MYRRESVEDCARQLVDRFEHAGGDPRIEGAVVLPFRDRNHLFVIASWPIRHRGIDAHGTYYQIRAYRADPSGALEQSEELARHIDASGIEGTADDEPSTFLGKNADELQQLLQERGEGR